MESLAYRLIAQHPWAIREEALEALVEMVRIRATVPEMAAALPQRAPPRAGATGIIPIRGVLKNHAGNSLFDLLFGATTYESIAAALREQVADESIRSIVLDIDSPGGSSYGMTELAAEIRRLRGKKPIVAVANHLAASAAFDLGASTDQFFASPSALVGSVGVYALHMEMSGMAEKEGIKPTYISAGKYKTEGNQFEPLSDEAREHMQGIVNDSYEQFVHDVARGRGVSDAKVRNDYGQGRVLTAKQARAAGMVDGIATLEQVIAKSASIVPRADRDEQAAEAGAVEIQAAETPPDQANEDEEGRQRLALIRFRALNERIAG